MTKPIWEAELDNQYACKVTRTDNSTGVLSVIDNNTGNELLNQTVILSYDAQFGPDYSDIGYWEELIIGVVDSNKGFGGE